MKARLPRITRALALLAVAVTPLVATTLEGDAVGFTATAEGQGAVVRAVESPEAVFAVGSQPFQSAQAVARAHWSVDACGGQVALSWEALEDDINAQSSWTNPSSAYDHPQLNGNCKIVFNVRAEYDWAKFCTVLVHEYGHLNGRPHAGDPGDVMAAYYTVPLGACSPVAPTPPAPVATAALAPPTASSARTVTTRAATAKKKTTTVKKHRKAKRHKKAKKTKKKRTRRTAKRRHRTA
jgi:hypothetical protein